MGEGKDWFSNPQASGAEPVGNAHPGDLHGIVRHSGAAENAGQGDLRRGKTECKPPQKSKMCKAAGLFQRLEFKRRRYGDERTNGAVATGES